MWEGVLGTAGIHKAIRRKRMTIWEYEIAVFSDTAEDGSEEKQENVLNIFGEDGWELVGVAVQAGRVFAYLKRSKGTF